ncbi:MAG: trypsin-like peptidase domain-containing protein [Alphaproteobacteria bacterium]|nr:trypsin-like peptidase domain-containing protein [Alphaproteobacteria bacterium]MCA0450330.1 serine protease [Pseudomonadota bacterium]
MPKIPREVLDAVIYLYPSRDAAEKVEGFGGTGFVVAIPGELFPNHTIYYYAVTNWHVAVREGHSTMRINTIDGGVDIFEYGPEEWHFDPRYDIAVLPFSMMPGKHKVSLINSNIFVKSEIFSKDILGIGEDVFMLGRFIDHDGGPTNAPAARFGNLSLLPSPILQTNDRVADSFCVDLHSRSGYSGSPVFIYRDRGFSLDLSNVTSTPDRTLDPPSLGRSYLGLLGIHWGQFSEAWEIVKGRAVPKKEAVSLDVEGQYVKGLSGMTCVLPAWCILEVLKMEKLRALREHHSRQEYAPFFANGNPEMGI